MSALMLPGPEAAVLALSRAAIEGGLLVLAIAAITRLFPRLPAATRTALWWLASLRLVAGLRPQAARITRDAHEQQHHELEFGRQLVWLLLHDRWHGPRCASWRRSSSAPGRPPKSTGTEHSSPLKKSSAR